MSDENGSENGPASTCDIVSITEAAARLDCSVRTVQRRLDKGTLDSIEVDGQRRVKLPRDNATANATRDTTGRQSDATPGTPLDATTRQNDAPQRDIKHELQGDSTRQVARHNATGSATPDATESAPQVLAGAFADDGSARVIELLERENAFLKSQIEAANRQAAEAHAALREALKMSNRALTEGDHKAVTEPSQSHLQVLAVDETGPKLVKVGKETARKLGQVGTDLKADKSDVQVLAEADGNEMQGNGGPLDTMATMATAETKGGANSQRVARDGRGLRGWLLKVLRG